MNLNKKLLSVLAILFLFIIAWIVVLELTQQRIHLEGQSKIQALSSKQTPFVWDFEEFKSDVVRPYQKFWKMQNGGDSIYAEKGTNPILSLNFSGEIINSIHYNTIQLKSPANLHGTLKLQIKVLHEDKVFNYSNPIELVGNDQLISLNQEWVSIDEFNNKSNDFKWPGKKNQVSSLVLQFTNPDGPLLLSSISLPSNRKINTSANISIDCKGNINNKLIPKDTNYNVFVLNELCWLPSNYMWLKDYVGNQYPGAILLIDNTDLIMGTFEHKVNTNYSQILFLNLIFYTFIALFIIAVYFLMNSNRQPAPVFKHNKDFSMTIAYSVILGPSILLLLIMSWYKMPDITTFKLLPMYFLWAIIQQFIVGYILAEKIFYKSTQKAFLSSFYAATIFALFHLPSITLVLVTFVAGFFWSLAWLRFKRIIPLAISHTLLALMFYYVISDRILYSARVFHWFLE